MPEVQPRHDADAEGDDPINATPHTLEDLIRLNCDSSEMGHVPLVAHKPEHIQDINRLVEEVRQYRSSLRANILALVVNWYCQVNQDKVAEAHRLIGAGDDSNSEISRSDIAVWLMYGNCGGKHHWPGETPGCIDIIENALSQVPQNIQPIGSNNLGEGFADELRQMIEPAKRFLQAMLVLGLDADDDRGVISFGADSYVEGGLKGFLKAILSSKEAAFVNHLLAHSNSSHGAIVGGIPKVPIDREQILRRVRERSNGSSG